ncbi:MAG: protein translocase SEC61 complex subunit gamma [Candidatus Diapherotrites archaeon]
MGLIGSFIDDAKRIFTVSRKPDWKEFITIAKITAIGIAIIALIGYVIIFLVNVLGVF